MGRLDGKVAIITGATSGIGERMAEMFVSERARVVVAGRREAEGRALEAKCGPAMSFIRTDVTDETSVKAMVDHAVTHFGRLDCLVNNAGSGSPMVSITDVAAEHFSAVFDTNVRGAMFGMKHAARVMIAQGSGSIITIASAAGLRGGLSGHIQCVQSGGHSFVAQRRVGNQQPGCSRQHDFSGRHCHRHLRQGCRARRRQG
jgi:NAD(P)-dependent dehydrogenase (short-subunit alcohol dehydrogenase family)